MFRFAAQNKVYWPVSLRVRTEDGMVEEKAIIGYQLLSHSELRARDKKVLQLRIDSMEEAGENLSERERLTQVLQQSDAHDAERRKLLTERIFDWRNIVDANDEPLAFDRAVLKAMLEDNVLLEDLWTGLMMASTGAVRKN